MIDSDGTEKVAGFIKDLTMRHALSGWSSDEVRSKHMRSLNIAQLGTKNQVDEAEFLGRVSEIIIRTQVPNALRAAGRFCGNEDFSCRFFAAAARCEIEGTAQSALAAKQVAVEFERFSASNGKHPHYAVTCALAAAHSSVEASIDGRAAAYAVDMATAFPDAALSRAAALAAYTLALGSDADDADYVRKQAEIADSSAVPAARDRHLGHFSEMVAHILIDMKSASSKILTIHGKVDG